MSDVLSNGLVDVISVLGDQRRDQLFVCIQDLLENGIDLARFSGSEHFPDRQSVTQYLAAWSREARLSEEETQSWLVPFSVSKLASLSRRSPAAIRHSTLSNIKYIYRSQVLFTCQRENNPFQARCCSTCPLHSKMPKRIEELAQPRIIEKPVTPLIPRRKKEVYREQYEEGLRFALEESRKGTDMPEILEMMKQKGFKTKTGKDWSLLNLYTCLHEKKRQEAKPKFERPSSDAE